MKTKLILLPAIFLTLSGCVSKSYYLHEERTETGTTEIHIEHIETKNREIVTKGSATNVEISRLIAVVEKKSNLKIVLSDEISDDTPISFSEVEEHTWIEFLETVLPQNGMLMEFVSDETIRFVKS